MLRWRGFMTGRTRLMRRSALMNRFFSGPAFFVGNEQGLVAIRTDRGTACPYWGS